MTMNTGGRVFIVSRDPSSLVRLSEALDVHNTTLELSPAADLAVIGGANELHAADVLLLDAPTVLGLWRDTRGGKSRQLPLGRSIVLVRRQELLPVAARVRGQIAMIPLPWSANPSFLIHLALAGYVVLPAPALRRLHRNSDRRAIVAAMSPDERRVLTGVAAAWSAKRIQTVTGLEAAKVKSLTQGILRKLHLTNRTAVAVFMLTSQEGKGRSGLQDFG